MFKYIIKECKSILESECIHLRKSISSKGVDPQELKWGIEAEKEHTNDSRLSRQIAKEISLNT